MPQSNLITITDPRSSVSEAYRTLRTNLEFSSLETPLRSLLVVSPSADADAVTTLANLGMIMAEGGRKVILVEGDLRKPGLHEVFGLPNKEGLSDLFQEGRNLAALPLQDSGVAGVRILTSGPLPLNPSVLLGSERMSEIVVALAKQADLVMFSAPPIVAVTDAALLAARVDGTLLIVRAGGTAREHVQRAKSLLDKVKARLIGAVLTNANPDRSVSGYYKH